jgi:hypothetical protein
MKPFFHAALFVCLTSILAPSASAKGLKVELRVEGLHCLEPSPHSRSGEDRVFIMARGKSPGKDHSLRLPDDDRIYRGPRNVHLTQIKWQDGENKTNTQPVIWNGTLREGQSARFAVVFAAQVHDDLPVTAADITDVWGWRDLASHLQENTQDVFGSFTVVIKNVDGRLRVAWTTGDYARHLVGNGNATPWGPDAAFFELRGASGISYNMLANVCLK